MEPMHNDSAIPFPLRARSEAGRAQSIPERVADENRSAAAGAAVIASDPRWVFAARAHTALEAGGRLNPARREDLIAFARRRGIRPFDAHMILALVQDRARRGEELAGIMPVLSIIDVETPPSDHPPRPLLFSMLLILGASVLCTLFLIRWILGA